MRRELLAVSAFLLIPSVGVASDLAESSLAWESKVSQDIQKDIQSRILDPILGPGRASVFVDLRVDILSKFQRNLRSGLGNSWRARATDQQSDSFLWSPDFEKPPFLDKASKNPKVTLSRMAQGQRVSVSKDEDEEVASASLIPKTLSVLIVIDKDIQQAQRDLVRQVIIDAYPLWKFETSQIQFRPVCMGKRSPLDAAALPFGGFLKGILLLGATLLLLALAPRLLPTLLRAPVFLVSLLKGLSTLPLPAKSLVVPSLFLGLTAFGIFEAEGPTSFRPFLNAEAFLFVFGGTIVAVWSAYSIHEIATLASPRMVSYAADASVGMGALGTLLGCILLLSSIDDVTAVPRRLSLALTSLFFGVLLSEVVLRPLAHRLGRAYDGSSYEVSAPAAGRRLLMTVLGLGTVLVAFFAILYALTAALSR